MGTSKNLPHGKFSTTLLVFRFLENPLFYTRSCKALHKLPLEDDENDEQRRNN